MSDLSLGRRIRGLRGDARRKAIGDVLSRLSRWSGSRKAFCEHEGIAAITLMRWERELASAAAGESGSGLVELRPTSSEPVVALELVLPSGIVVRVREGARTDDVKRTLHALGVAC